MNSTEAISSSNSSPVYICFIDLSKAFDRLNHNVLFTKLLEREVPHIVVRLLKTWYATQQFSIQWGNCKSSAFNVTNGVRQGGILSPIMFNVCMDSLSQRLLDLNIGCHMNNVCYNHLIYADDTALLAPSPNALQSLIDVCVEFAKENGLVFNAKKTKCMCVKPAIFHKLYVPNFFLDGHIVTVVENEIYLGFNICSKKSDDESIKKEMRNLYARGNVLIRNFKHCTNVVKVALFKSFCSSIYCCSLWSSQKVEAIRKIHVAFNKIFKCLMNVKYDFSASLLFVSNRTDNFTVLRRKACVNLFIRVKSSNNQLIKSISSSMFFFQSSVYKQWKSLIF